MAVEQNVWGFTPEGEAVVLYTLTNSSGAQVKLTNIGAAVVSVVVPDREGSMEDVVLGYDRYSYYFNDGSGMGKTIGRFANRIGGGKFTLDGAEYTLPLTGQNVTLHGGPQGFANRIWESRVEEDKVVFSLVSPDGDQGFPGELGVEAVYSWDDDCRLEITLMSASDAPTVVNLTNHCYFNLAGHSAGSVLNHNLKIAGSHYLETDKFQIPTGRVVPVDGTPMDFRSAKPVGRDIYADYPPLTIGAGYDHCWTLDGYGHSEIFPAAVLEDPQSGRRLEIKTTQPSIQVYTGNFLQGVPEGKGGVRYANRGGIAMECQGYPDAPNHPGFPSTELRPGETYCEKIIYKFTTGEK
ncbi:MAG: galactose mutarotase [Rikenellaceae bacterium]|nr:galactose mutarotase [Rikenellaceae bacterium]